MKVWDRVKAVEISEPILSERQFRFLYEHPVGIRLARHILNRHWFSHLYGLPRSMGFSRHSINGFIQKYNLDVSDFDDTDWQTFNDFFIRKFKKGRRLFSDDPYELGSPCEGRLSAYINSIGNKYSIKGLSLNLSELLRSPSLAREFASSYVLIFRLSPFDYHRFHYFDGGDLVESYRVPGVLNSVHPLSLKVFPRVLVENERKVNVMSTEQFGRVLAVEIGALCVGRIVSHDAPFTFRKGQEKGYFLFGGSTLIYVIKRNHMQLDRDLLDMTAKDYEIFVRLGEKLGVAGSDASSPLDP